MLPTHGQPTRSRARAAARTVLCAAACAAAAPAHALPALAAVGPVGASHPFPTYVEDAAGLQLAPCLDQATPNCALIPQPGPGPRGTVFDPARPIAFPANFPGEIFYSAVSADVTLGTLQRAFAVMLNLEGTFAAARDGGLDPAQPTLFTRIRLEQHPALALTPGATYRFTHPFGVDAFVADAAGRLFPAGKKFFTVDRPDPLVAGAFAAILSDPANRLGVFLTTSPPALAPAGFVGDGSVPHAVAGSPAGTNFFRVEGPGLGPGSCGADCLESDAFVVVGQRYHGPAARLVVSGLAPAQAGVPQVASIAAIDAHGNSAIDYVGPVHLTSSDPGAPLPPDVALANGVGSAVVTPRTAGPFTLTATDAASPAISGAQQVAIAPGLAAALAAVAGAGQSGAVASPLASPLVARVLDAFGNPVPGVLVEFAPPPGGAVVPPSALTGADGTAAAVARLPSSAGAATFGASVAGALALTATFDAQALPGAAQALAIGGPASATAGAPASFEVTAVDAFGNVATGFSGPLALSSDDPSAALSAPAALAAGSARVSATWTRAGPRRLVASAPPLSGAVAVGVSPGAPAAIFLSASPLPAVVGASAPFTVEVDDAFGNAVPRAPVALQAATPGASVTPALAVTDGAGRAAGAATLGTAAGDYAFAASSGALTIPFRVTALAGAPAALRLEARSPTAVLDCGCVDAVVLAVDAFGNRAAGAVPGVTATLSGAARIAATDLAPSGVGAAAATATGALLPDGSAAVRVCGTRAEAVTLGASLPGGAAATLALSFRLGPPDAVASAVAVDAPVLAAWSGRATVRVTPRTACGNPLGPGHAVALALDGPGSLSAVSDAGDGTYAASLRVSPCPSVLSTRVLARADGVELAPATVAIACTEVSPERTEVAVSRREVVMCDDAARDAVAFTVVPRDPSGARLGPGNSVALATAGAVAGEVKDAGDGSYTGTFTAERCGAAALPLALRVNGVGVAPDGLSVAFPCAPVDPAASGLTVAAAHARAGDDVRVTVAATNACGEPARGRPVAIAEDLGAPVAPSGVTDAAGTFTTTVRGRGPGADRVAATVDGVALPAVAITWDAPRGGGCGSAGDGAAIDALALAAALLALRGRRQAPTPTGQDTPVPPRPQ